MTRTIVAFPTEEASARVEALLESAGIKVRCRCRTGAEVLRTVRRMGGGVVVVGYKLRDMTAEELARELSGEAYFLLLARGELLSQCSGDLFRLAIPIKPGELRGALAILTQLDEASARASIPKRTEEDEDVITRAKALLMRRDLMTEEEAHRYLQRKSMDSGVKLADTARRILKDTGGTQ